MASRTARKFRSSCWLTALLLTLSPLAGCSEGEGGGGSAIPGSSSEKLPTRQPGITGVVTLAEAGSIRVEADPTEESGSPKALVRVTPETRVMYRSGESSAAEDLTLGHHVSVWFAGPVMESYPVQASAREIVIEPAVDP